MLDDAMAEIREACERVSEMMSHTLYVRPHKEPETATEAEVHRQAEAVVNHQAKELVCLAGVLLAALDGVQEEPAIGDPQFLSGRRYQQGKIEGMMRSCWREAQGGEG